jgi:hypothetical protein
LENEGIVIGLIRPTSTVLWPSGLLRRSGPRARPALVAHTCDTSAPGGGHYTQCDWGGAAPTGDRVALVVRVWRREHEGEEWSMPGNLGRAETRW